MSESFWIAVWSLVVLLIALLVPDEFLSKLQFEPPSIVRLMLVAVAFVGILWSFKAGRRD